MDENYVLVNFTSYAWDQTSDTLLCFFSRC